MISRIRLEAFGVSAAAVEHTLHQAANSIDEHVFGSPAFSWRGEQVIERAMEEPEGSRHAFHGRLLLHPDTAEAVAEFPDGSSAKITRFSGVPAATVTTSSASQ